jgi:tetratricopeptide (TPR) repeat protein
MLGSGGRRAARAAGFLVWLLGAAACSSPGGDPETATPESERRLADVAALDSKGRTGDALLLCEEILAAQPGLVTARVRAADLARRAGDVRGAADHARRALAHPPEDPADLAALARALASTDPRRAQTVLAPLLESSPGRTDVELAAAEVALARNDRSGALGHLRRAAATEPAPAQKLDLARGFSRAGFHDDAVEVARGAIAAGDASAEARYTLAWTLEQAERYDECVHEYFALLEDHPDHLAAYLNLGALMARDGELERAVALWERGLRHDPGNESLRANVDQALEALGLSRKEGSE